MCSRHLRAITGQPAARFVMLLLIADDGGRVYFLHLEEPKRKNWARLFRSRRLVACTIVTSAGLPEA
jgi:hypothetical protein